MEWDKLLVVAVIAGALGYQFVLKPLLKKKEA